MFLMRFTVVDGGGTISFVASGHLLKMLTAGCSHQPVDHRELLNHVGALDHLMSESVLNGLAVFDEHNSARTTAAFQAATVVSGTASPPPFRVVDPETRRQSLEPAAAGLVVINLVAKRIVQVQNVYSDVRREDRGRIRRQGRPTRDLYRYVLPPDWSIVP